MAKLKLVNLVENNLNIAKKSTSKDFSYSASEDLCGQFGSIALKSSTKKELKKRLEIAKTIMDETPYPKKLQISSIAKSCMMSEFYFFRCFKALFNITPNQYIIQNRLNKAQELILKKDKTITEIAIECGYPDLFSFSKAYKKHFGVSPAKHWAYFKNMPRILLTK